MSIQKIMISGNKMRIIIIVLISIATGFIISISMDSTFLISQTENMFTQNTMNEVLWIESGYNELYSDASELSNKINLLKNREEISDVSIQFNCISESTGNMIFAVSNKLLTTMPLPLYKGNWFPEQTDYSYIPAIVSFDLLNKYDVDILMPISISSTISNHRCQVKIKVIGILNEYGGFPDLNSSQFITYPNIRNNIFWHSLDNTIIIPLESLPSNYEIDYSSVADVMAIHMNGNIADNKEQKMKLQKDLYNSGFGITNDGFVWMDRSKTIDSYDTGRQHTMIFVFLFLTIVGVICYNITFAYYKKRDFSILQLLGISKGRLSFNWTLMIGYAHILPILIGLSLGQSLLSNGRVWFPYQQQMKWEIVVLLAMAILSGTYYISFRFLSSDISKSIKE